MNCHSSHSIDFHFPCIQIFISLIKVGIDCVSLWAANLMLGICQQKQQKNFHSSLLRLVLLLFRHFPVRDRISLSHVSHLIYDSVTYDRDCFFFGNGFNVVTARSMRVNRCPDYRQIIITFTNGRRSENPWKSERAEHGSHPPTQQQQQNARPIYNIQNIYIDLCFSYHIHWPTPSWHGFIVCV